MAKKRKKNPNPQTGAPAVQNSAPKEPSVPKFEIGVKGDEFDMKYSRAAAEKTSDADNLLRSLSKDTWRSSYNLLNFAVIVLLVIFIALSFALLSRGGRAPKLSAEALSDGSYAENMSAYYKETLPFGRALRTLGAYLGFCDMPEPLPPAEPMEPDDDVPDDPPPAVTAATEPVVTTAPTTTEAPTSAPITEPTELTVPETNTMYVKTTTNVRLLPEADSMILGYFSKNDEVEVIEIFDDGWASIWYGDMVAYVSSENLNEKPVKTSSSTTRRRSDTDETSATEEPEPEITETTETEEPETTAEETTVPEETTAATTTSTEYTGYTGTVPPQTGSPPPTTTEPTTPTPPPTTEPSETDPPETDPPETDPPEPTVTDPPEPEPPGESD